MLVGAGVPRPVLWTGGNESFRFLIGYQRPAVFFVMKLTRVYVKLQSVLVRRLFVNNKYNTCHRLRFFEG